MTGFDDYDSWSMRCEDPYAYEEFNAADGGEESDMMDPDKLTPVQKQEVQIAVEIMPTTALVALRYQIETELKKRVDTHEREAKAARMALDGIKPRATRSDAGRPRAPKVEAARDENGVPA
jgi:hypothetical protein